MYFEVNGPRKISWDLINLLYSYMVIQKVLDWSKLSYFQQSELNENLLSFPLFSTTDMLILNPKVGTLPWKLEKCFHLTNLPAHFTPELIIVLLWPMLEMKMKIYPETIMAVKVSKNYAKNRIFLKFKQKF